MSDLRSKDAPNGYERRPPTEEEHLTHAREQLDLTRWNTANIRRHLALLYGHNENEPAGQPTPPGAAAATYRQLAAARREYAQLEDKMADYQDTEGYRNDATARRQVAAYEYSVAEYDQAIAEELETAHPPGLGGQ